MKPMTENKYVVTWIEYMQSIVKPEKVVWITGEEEQLDVG